MNVNDLFMQAAKEFAQRRGASYGIVTRKPLVLRFELPDGARFWTHKTKVPLNSRVTAGMLVDKWITVSALENEGISAPRTLLIDKRMKKRLSGADEERGRAAHRIKVFIKKVGGYPVFVKPNKGSQGRDVYRVDSAQELNKIMRKVVVAKHGGFLVQEACSGEEYRIISINGKIVLGIRKKPLSVVGDGRHTIKHLIEVQFAQLRAEGRSIKIGTGSAKIKSHLGKQGFGLSSVLGLGREVVVLANKNLSDGGSPEVCTEEVKRTCARLVEETSRKLNIKYCGFDVIMDTRHKKVTPTIIELNGSPGFAHFIRTAPSHQAIVKDVFAVALDAAYKDVRVSGLKPGVPVRRKVASLNKAKREPV